MDCGDPRPLAQVTQHIAQRNIIGQQSQEETMTKAVEELFVTRVYDDTFNMIEDESGDIWWGYGHQNDAEFTDEVNRWLIRECGVTHPDDLFAANKPVEHLWARMNGDDDERFTLAEPVMRQCDADLFPVTRLMI
jgi:hypothetical protein